MEPIKCPACDGWGYREVWQRSSASPVPDKVSCLACKGTGVFSYDLHFTGLIETREE